MGFLKKLLWIASGKAALMQRFEQFEKEGKPALTRQLVYLRLAREQALPLASEFSDSEVAGDFAQARVEQIKSLLADSSDAELMGTPEATIVITVQQYWSFKAGTKLTDLDVFHKIENLRSVLGAPKGAALPGIDLPTFVIHVIRSENPECTPENISDETIRALVGIANDAVKELFDFLPNNPT